VADYRVRIVSMEGAANGDVNLDCFVQRDDEGVWVEVPSGHRTMVLSGAAVLAIVRHPTWTDQEKRAALVELFRATAEGWGIDESDEAVNGIEGLLPAPLPINVAL